MKALVRKRMAPPIGPRSNQWKGARASQIADQCQQAHREKLLSRRRRAWRVGQWLLGLAALAWGLTIVTREMGPMFQGWLEIRHVEVEGIHQVKKSEIVERLVLKPGMGLHQVSTAFLVERVQAHAWVKEATVERRLPHSLHVTVVERAPAAIISVGVDHWLSDEDGHLLAKLGRQDDQTLPLLIGVEAQSLQHGEARARHSVQSGVVLAKLIANTFGGRIEVDLTNVSNVVVLANGMRFQFGGDALVDQWERFRKVNPSFKAGPSDDRKDAVNEIDLRYDNRVIVRERV